jgi:hypothetical protein
MGSGRIMMKRRAVAVAVVLAVCVPVLSAAQAGKVVAWGINDYGQTQAPSGDDFVAIAAGGYHCLALRTDGSIAGWGNDDNGQATPPPDSNFVAIAAGWYHSVALRTDGSIVSWGAGWYGQTASPQGTGYKSIAAGGAHCLALRTDGSIAGWGNDFFGQATPPSETGFTAIAAGNEHSIALRADGSIVGWGSNNAFTDAGETVWAGQATPPSGTGFVAIAAGSYHSIALRADGSIVQWGYNPDNHLTPPYSTGFTAISGGWCHNLALKTDESVKPWGLNDHGQSKTPSGKDYIAVAAGYHYSLALQDDDTSPSPSPMTWSFPPQATSSTSVAMTATVATDLSGVEYMFSCTAGPGHDSGWQSSPSYTDTGLHAGDICTYTVKARDASARQNETAPSAAVQAAIPASAPAEAAGPAPSDGAAGESVFVHLGWSNGGGAESYDVYFGTSASLGAADMKAEGIVAAVYDVGRVGSQRTYYWRIDSRNVCGTTTGRLWSFTTGAGPLLEKSASPAPSDGAADVYIPLALGWSNGSAGVSYDVYFGTSASLGLEQRIAAGIVNRMFFPGTLQYLTRYYWRVDTMVSYGVVTGDVWSFTTGAEPDTAAPTPNPMTWQVAPHATSPTTVAMTATAAADTSAVEYYFACTMGGRHDSGWQDSATYVDSGLAPGTTFTYLVKARDKSPWRNETGWSGAASATTPQFADDTNTFAFWRGDSTAGALSPDDTSVSHRTAVPLVIDGGSAPIGLSAGRYGQALDFGTNGRQMGTASILWPAANTAVIDAPGNEIKLDGWFYIPNIAALPIPSTAGGSGAATTYVFQISTSSAGASRCYLAVNQLNEGTNYGTASLYWQKTNNGSTIKLPLYRYYRSTGMTVTDANALNLTGKWLHIVAYAQYASPVPAWDAGYNRTQLEVSDPGTGTTYTVHGANTGVLSGSGSNVWVGQISGRLTYAPYRGWRGLIDELKLSTRVHAPMAAYGPAPADNAIVLPSANLVASWCRAAPFNPADSIIQDVWVGTTPVFDPCNVAGWTRVASGITDNSVELGPVQSGVTYYWKVDSIDSGTGATTPSDIWSFTTFGAPAAPGGVSATDGDFGDRVRVTWNSVPGADGYQLWWNSTNEISTAQLLTEVAGNANTTLDDVWVELDATYWYWVRAFNTIGYSEWSNPDSGFASLFKADFVVAAKRRVGRTTFDYDCTVTLINNGSQAVRVTGLQLLSAPANVTVVDASVSGFGDIAPGGSATSTDTCTLRVDRSQLIDASQVRWQVTYETLSGQVMQLSGISPLALEPGVVGDMSGDGAVDSTDLLMLAEQWLTPKAGGTVNFADFAIMAGQWSQSTAP